MRKIQLGHDKQDRLIEHFISGSSALTTARLCAVNRKVSALFLRRLRECIASVHKTKSEAMFGVGIEVGERYFGGNYKTIPDGIAYSEFFPDKKNTINGIENLWTHGKHHMPNFNSVPKAKFG